MSLSQGAREQPMSGNSAYGYETHCVDTANGDDAHGVDTADGDDAYGVDAADCNAAESLPGQFDSFMRVLYQWSL